MPHRHATPHRDSRPQRQEPATPHRHATPHRDSRPQRQVPPQPATPHRHATPHRDSRPQRQEPPRPATPHRHATPHRAGLPSTSGGISERHVFVDNSNIFIGAQHRGGTLDPSTRISPTAIARLLQANGTAVAVGSKPPASSGIWQRWEQAGFRTKVCARDENDREDTVDDFLQNQINRTLHHCAPATLVLATGDGNANGGWGTFPEAVQLAAERGWKVEVWSWRACRSGEFRRLAAQYPARVKLVDLDDHAHEILYYSDAR